MLSSCEIHKNSSEFQTYSVTFRIIVKTIPDSAAIHITGNNTLLGNFYHPNAPALKKRKNGEWYGTFRFPQDLHVRCLFNLGSPLNTAVNEKGQPLDTLFFIVIQDTEIVVEIANWQDQILSQEEKSNPNYLAEKFFLKAGFLRFHAEKFGFSDSIHIFYEKAAELFQKQANWERLVQCYYVMSGTYPPSTNLQYLHKSLAISLSYLGENHIQTEKVYKRLSDYHNFFGDYELALKYINRSLTICRRIHSDASNHLYGAYLALGGLSLSIGKYEESMEYYQKALIESKKIAGSTFQEIGNVNKSIAMLYANMGNFEKAIEHFKHAMKIHALYNDELSVAMHMNYFHLGEIFLRAGEYGNAEEYFKKSLNIRKQMYFPYHGHIASAYNALAKATLKQKDYESALLYQQQALKILIPGFSDENIYKNPSLDNIFYYRWAVLKSLEKKGNILLNLVQEQYKVTGVYPQDAKTKLDAAIDCYNKSLRQAALALGGFLSTKSKLSLQQRLIVMVEQAIQCASLLFQITGESKYKELAWHFNESGKCVLLRLAVQESQVIKFTGINNNYLEKEQRLRKEIIKHETSLTQAYQTKEHTDYKITNLEKSYYTIKSQYESLISNFESRYPHYFAQKYNIPTATIGMVQNFLDKENILIEYFVGEQNIHIFVISSDAFEIVSLPKDNNFESQVMNYVTSIRKLVDKEVFFENSRNLYSLLIQPIKQYIDSKKKLSIIPDGILYYVPFESLLSQEKGIEEINNFTNLNFLIKKYEISYHYSATLLIKSGESQKTETPLLGQLITFAPVFRKQNHNSTISTSNLEIIASLDRPQKEEFVTRDGRNFKELHHSEDEVLTIAELFASHGSKVYLHHMLRKKVSNLRPVSIILFMYQHTDL